MFVLLRELGTPICMVTRPSIFRLRRLGRFRLFDEKESSSLEATIK
jgi:hypothetical protein